MRSSPRPSPAEAPPGDVSPSTSPAPGGLCNSADASSHEQAQAPRSRSRSPYGRQAAPALTIAILASQASGNAASCPSLNDWVAPLPPVWDFDVLAALCLACAAALCGLCVLRLRTRWSPVCSPFASWMLSYIASAFPDGSSVCTSCSHGLQLLLLYGLRITQSLTRRKVALAQVCRLLAEPPVASIAEQEHLDHMRALAGEMGLPWPFCAPFLPMACLRRRRRY